MNRILIGICPGELLDRISILQLKCQHAADPPQQLRFSRELESLLAAAGALPDSPELRSLFEQLQLVNRRLWNTEDQLRACERNSEFASGFIELARSVYQDNDRRALLRRQINQLLKVEAGDEKLYAR